MVLLHAAARVSQEIELDLAVLHVNHGLRGRDSDGDQKFVVSAARKLGLKCHSKKLRGLRGQAACRAARLAFFRKIASRASDRILTAHHLDDQAETLLLRLLRGTGKRGLGCMRPSSGQLLRPFLAFSKAELAGVASEWGLSWREDASNQSTKYERNWIRHEILPRFEQRRPGAARRIAALAGELAALPKPSSAKQDAFVSGDARFYRMSHATPEFLSAEFGLGRAHSEQLSRLLEVGSGRLDTPGQQFHFSCGVLRATKKGGDAPSVMGKAKGQVWISALGKWRVSGAILTPGGDSWKKRCQEANVPVFFRQGIPWVERNGRKQLQLTDAKLSELGHWFFNASPASGSPAPAKRAKAENHPITPR